MVPVPEAELVPEVDETPPEEEEDDEDDEDDDELLVNPGRQTPTRGSWPCGVTQGTPTPHGSKANGSHSLAQVFPNAGTQRSPPTHTSLEGSDRNAAGLQPPSAEPP